MQEGASSPTQEDEADIIAEVGAERDEELDELVATEEKVVAIGAVDAESVRENRRLGAVVGKKRANMKNVPFNASDVLVKFDWIVKYWPPNSLHIKMKRLTGSEVQHTIRTFPRSGMELYAALMEYHGVSDEAKYEVVVTDSTTHEFRGKGQITLPDTQPKQSQGGYPMNAPQQPWQPPPGQQPWQPPAQGAPPQAQPQQQQPQQGVPPPGPDPVAMMQQIWKMLQPQQGAPQQQADPQQGAPQQPPAQVFVPPPPGPDPVAMMQQIWKMLQQQPPAQPGSAQPAQPQANPTAAMTGMMVAPPPMDPPPGTIRIPTF